MGSCPHRGWLKTACRSSARENCPKLTDADAAERLGAIAVRARDRIKSRWDLEMPLVVIDAMSSATLFKDADDTAENQRVMSMLAGLSLKLQTLILVVDHFGKDVSTGTRNSSAKEFGADAVLAILCERSTAGKVKNSRMAIRKVRDAPTGQEIEFKVRVARVADEFSPKLQETLVIEWDAAWRDASARERPRSKRSLKIFMTALEKALCNSSQSPFPDRPEVKAVDRNKVRDEFLAGYPAKNYKAKSTAFARCEKETGADKIVGSREIGSITSQGADQNVVMWRHKSTRPYTM